MEIIIATLSVLFGGGGVFAYQKIKTANAKNNSDKIIDEARKKSLKKLTNTILSDEKKFEKPKIALLKEKNLSIENLTKLTCEPRNFEIMSLKLKNLKMKLKKFAKNKRKNLKKLQSFQKKKQPKKL